LILENYIVNVKARKVGSEELSPVWRRIEKYIQFEHGFPLIIGALSLASYLTVGFGLWSIPLTFAFAFPVALIVSINDALTLWHDSNISEELESSRAPKVKLKIIRATQTSVLPAWFKRLQGWFWS
jgi:hypothetical protein